MDRRLFLKNTALSAVALKSAGLAASDTEIQPGKKAYKRIAVEESFIIPEIFNDLRNFAANGVKDEPGLMSLWGEAINSPGVDAFAQTLIDIGDGRLSVMDAAGVDIQILSLTSPGVQIYEEDRAISMARLSNDMLAEGISANPTRFAGLAAVAPQNPAEAARELERGVTKLGLKGAIINSHTKGEYLDDRKYWAIFEAAQALNVPIYLHPRTPSADMIKPFVDYPMEGAVWGFKADTGLHALRLILSGVFDEFPQLKIILGHLGEGLPFWMKRIDTQFKGFTFKNSPRALRLKLTPSEYFKNNFVISTSGMNWEDEILFCHKVVGVDNIMFAVDHPFVSSTESVSVMDRLPVSENDLLKMYQLNAEKVFSL